VAPERVRDGDQYSMGETRGYIGTHVRKRFGEMGAMGRVSQTFPLPCGTQKRKEDRPRGASPPVLNYLMLTCVSRAAASAHQQPCGCSAQHAQSRRFRNGSATACLQVQVVDCDAGEKAVARQMARQ